VVQEQLRERGIGVSEIEAQLERFRTGFPRIQLVRPCTPGDGIRQLTPEEEDHFITRYEAAMAQGRAMKFVPASGAATRMFRDLQQILTHYDRYVDSIQNKPEAQWEESLQPLRRFVDNLHRFAFYEALQEVLRRAGQDLAAILRRKDYRTLLTYLLTEKGLNYGQLPKALILFHRANHRARTPIEEHLVEGRHHVRDAQGNVRLHFTVPVAYQESIARFVQQVQPEYEQDGVRFHIDYSTQNPALDLIAVDFHNRPIRDASGRLVFRPGGHGALLENLNALKGDIVFIKNIDNVVPDAFKDPVVRYKKVLGGILVAVQQQIFDFLNRLEAGQLVEADFVRIEQVLKEWMFEPFPDDYSSWSLEQRKAYLRQRLDRPLRVCGMVKNEGEPGGGPFWVKGRDGSLSLQIVEQAQVDTRDAEQQRIWEQSTHFNPTDLVCGVRNFKGQPFDLMRFRDPETGFITVKYLEGQEVRVMELPGLWNGSMAFWNSIFVEVPLETFNPVKTVFDLLRPRHLGATADTDDSAG